MNDRARILVIILVVAVVGGIAGTGIYRERVAPFRMVVLRVGLPDALAALTFDQLAVGGHGGPVPMGQSAEGTAFAIVRVADRVAAREVTGDALEAAKALATDQWFAGEYRFHRVSFHGFNNGYDAETDAWVTWQLRRMRRMGQ